MALFNSLEFDGVNSLDSGIYITGEAVYNAPQRQVEMVTIPGRNGTLAIDQGRFENIEVTYPAGCFADDQSDFADKIMEFRNELASRFGYKRLVDTYHPDEFRLGTYSAGLEVGAVGYHRAGEFDITFDCKPQRFLVSGEEAVTIGEWGETETATGDIVEIDNPDGTLGAKSLLVTLEPIQDLHGYDKPWAGGAGKNKVDCADISAPSTSNTTYSVGLGSASYVISFDIVNAVRENLSNTSFLNIVSSGANNYYTGETILKVSDNSTLNSAGANINGRYYCTISNKAIDSLVFLWRSNSYAQLSSGAVKNIMVEVGTTPSAYEPYSNICPISGRDSVETQRTGKNLFSVSIPTQATWAGTSSDAVALLNSLPNGTYTLTSRNTITAVRSGQTPVDRVIGVWARSSIISPSLLNCRTTLTQAQIAVGNSFTSTITFTIDDNSRGKFTQFYLYSGDDKLNVTSTFDIQLELGSTATDYEPYNGTTHTTSLGRTVYGGTLDVVSGVLTVDRAMVTFNGSEYWVIVPADPNAFFLTNLSDAYPNLNSKLPIVCDTFEVRADTTSASTYPNGTAWFIYRQLHLKVGTDIAPSGLTSQGVAELKAWLANNPITVVLPLATPQTIQLTPQEVQLLLGDNNVWSDGDVAIEYGLLPNIIINPTLFASSPLLVVTGSGTLSIGNQTLTIASGSADQVIYIDCDSQEAWEIVGGGKLSRNDYIQNAGEAFPVLNPGANTITLGTGITELDITPRWWRI